MNEELALIKEAIESYKLAVKSMYGIAKGLKPKDAKPYIYSAKIFIDVIKDLEDDLAMYNREYVIEELEKKVSELQKEINSLKNQ